MSNVLDTMLERLPSHFNVDETSNNYKLLSLVARHADTRQVLYQTIERYQDIDQAQGRELDRIGKDEGISRGSYDEETYRKLIKIQYIVNLSEGDLESINTILRVYMENDFLWIQDGWESFFEEPASFIVNISPFTKMIPHELIRKLKPVGIAVYYAITNTDERFILKNKQYDFSVPYLITNCFQTDKINGAHALSNLQIEERETTWDVFYPITNMFTTTTTYESIANEKIVFRAASHESQVIYRTIGEETIVGEGVI